MESLYLESREKNGLTWYQKKEATRRKQIIMGIVIVALWLLIVFIR